MQAWLLNLQLGNQWLDTEAGLSHLQATHSLDDVEFLIMGCHFQGVVAKQ